MINKMAMFIEYAIALLVYVNRLDIISSCSICEVGVNWWKYRPAFSDCILCCVLITGSQLWKRRGPSQTANDLRGCQQQSEGRGRTVLGESDLKARDSLEVRRARFCRSGNARVPKQISINPERILLQLPGRVHPAIPKVKRTYDST